jgi:hypothetical protein
MTPEGRALTTRHEAPMPSATGTGVESPGRGGNFAMRAPATCHPACPWPSCTPAMPRLQGKFMAGLCLPSHLGPVGSGCGTGLAICRSENSTPVAGMGAAPRPAPGFRLHAGARAGRNAVDTPAGLSYNVHDSLTLCCSHQRSRSGSMSMNHAQPCLRFTAAPTVRSPACTLFLQRPQLLTRV